MKAHELGTTHGSVIYPFKLPQLEYPVPFQPVILGEYYCDQDYHVERNRYDSYLILYVVSGEGYATLGQQSYTLRTGDILFVDCYRWHCYGTNGSMHIQWLHFDGPMANAYFQRITKESNLVRMALHHPATHSLRKLLRHFQDHQATSAVLLSSYISNLLTEILLTSEQNSAEHKQAAVIDQSIHYIMDHLNEKLTLEQLAQQAMLSPFYFSRLFKEETGYSPYRYITMVRLNNACHLLRSTKLTVKEIAFQCGFRNESNFCTRFRATLGMTPQCYRISQ